MHFSHEQISGVSTASAGEVVEDAKRLGIRREAVFISMAFWRAWSMDFARNGLGLDQGETGVVLIPKNRIVRAMTGGILRHHEQSEPIHIPPGALHIGEAADLVISRTISIARAGWLSVRKSPIVDDVTICNASSLGERQEVIADLKASDYDYGKRHLGELALNVEKFSSILSTMVDVYNIDHHETEYKFPMYDIDHPEIRAHYLKNG